MVMSANGNEITVPDARRSAPGRRYPVTVIRAVQRGRTWLPEGRTVPELVWVRRHTLITRFALFQAFGLGVFAAVRGYPVMLCAGFAVLVGNPALLGKVHQASRRLRTLSVTVSLMLASITLVDIAGGVTEAHFHFFVMVGVVSMYQDWSAFGTCIVVTVVHHAVMGSLAPHSVFGAANQWANPVLWAAIHGVAVLAAALTHIFAWKANEQQLLSDPLTGLPNRTAFVEALARQLGAGSEPVSVLYVDMDGFKKINDSLGHSAGDHALMHTARRLEAAVRNTDLVARLGGDEFGILVQGAFADEAAVLGQRILLDLQEPAVYESKEVSLRASIGIADDRLAGSRDAEDLLHDADLAMYLSKASGRNQIVIYTAGVDKAVRARAALTEDLRSALARDQFEVLYQPVVDTADGRLHG
jgi:diguanylate cyclase (GGDEF)-like protein